jgi:hypothetical protein
MTASTTDVRQWFREQGRAEELPKRGSLSKSLLDEYDAAHPPGPVVAGEVTESDYPDLSMGVTEADFPPDETAQEPPQTKPQNVKSSRERKPRVVKPTGKQRITERIFGGKKTGHPRQPKRPRVDLSDFAEDTWRDLAWLAQPVPPLAAMLAIQAPYAGVVLDRHVKGTFLDPPMQAAARHADAFRAINGLAGPPVYVAAICLTGRRVEVPVIDGRTGQQVMHPETGRPVTVWEYDGRTKALFTGLRYSLLSMVRMSDKNIEEIQQRAEQAASDSAKVDAIIAQIFAMAPGPVPPPAPSPEAGGGEDLNSNGYRYPGASATAMDGTGADPGRI